MGVVWWFPFGPHLKTNKVNPNSLDVHWRFQGSRSIYYTIYRDTTITLICANALQATHVVFCIVHISRDMFVMLYYWHCLVMAAFTERKFDNTCIVIFYIVKYYILSLFCCALLCGICFVFTACICANSPIIVKV